ncbi:E3 ubiquitin-protein ligase dbl4 [Stagonosporopsis vannaccii]|nr:E3 ubiquitin-protein ligase dbl4 [Stagonosporopsis vannaccii]
MAPSTRLGARPDRRVDYRNVMPTGRVGSARNPIEVEDTLPPQVSATRATKTKEKDASKPARDAQGRFIKSDSFAKRNVDRNKVVKATPPPKKETKARPLKTECIICATTKSTKRSFKTPNLDGMCEHFESVCDVCVQKLIKTKMSQRQLDDASLACVFPGCEVTIDHAQLKMVLPHALFEIWDTAITKHLLAADSSYIACLNPECGTYFSVEGCGKHKTSNTKDKPKAEGRKKGSDKATCPYCNHDLCLSCTRPWHSGSCNSIKRREDKESEKVIKNMGAKPCPKCGINIEKQGGCDHMRCRNCRHNFCWECLGGLKGGANDHAETCSHHRPMIAHDVGNFVPENLTVDQVNALFERARRDRDGGRVPRPHVQLPPGAQVANGAILAHRPPQPPPGQVR